jgi:hypothetical protein
MSPLVVGAAGSPTVALRDLDADDVGTSAASFDELLPFFRRAGFMPPEKERVLAPFLPDVRETFDRAARGPEPLLGARVLREGADVVGYVSCVRSYERTWMFQHLAALPGRRGGPRLSQGIVEYLLGVEDCDYFKMWFYTKNPFPSRAYGEFARSIEGPDSSTLRVFGHVVLSTATRFASPASLRVEEANARSLDDVGKYLAAIEGPLVSDADDLDASRLGLDTVNCVYERRGLFRRRHVLVARSGDDLLGIALAEVSSPGLNLSEGLSSFRLYAFDGADGMSVRPALLNALCGLYARAGRPIALGLVPTADLPEYAALAFGQKPSPALGRAGRRSCPTFSPTSSRCRGERDDVAPEGPRTAPTPRGWRSGDRRRGRGGRGGGPPRAPSRGRRPSR